MYASNAVSGGRGVAWILVHASREDDSTPGVAPIVGQAPPDCYVLAPATAAAKPMDRTTGPSDTEHALDLVAVSVGACQIASGEA